MSKHNEIIELSPPPGRGQYSGIKFNGKSGRLLAQIVAHEWSNPDLEEDGKHYQCLHNHLSIYLVDDNGKRQGVIDFVHSREKPQMQIEGLAVVLKSPESQLIMRDKENDRYYELAMVNGELKTIEVEREYIAKANAVKRECDENGNAV